MKQDKQAEALRAIIRYIRTYKPKGAAKLEAQLKLIEEMALEALEQ